MKASRYWQFMLQEDQVKGNWGNTLSEYGKGFLSAPHDKDTNQAYAEACFFLRLLSRKGGAVW